MPPDTPSWIQIAIYLTGGFLLLGKGADWLVAGSARIARRLGVSVMVIGLTVVAWGTSAPEVVVSAVAARGGDSAIALGNVLGSNVANIGLVLAASALVLPKVLDAQLRTRDMVSFFGSIGILWAVCADSAITRVESGLLLFFYGIYTASLFLTRNPDIAEEMPQGSRRMPAWFETLIGFGAVLLGAKLAVDGATWGALRLGVDQRIVGLTVVAIGTSLPELAASLGSALKGETELSLGNVVGSNVFNLLAVLGIVGLVRPLEAAAMPDEDAREELAAAFAGALGLDFWVVLAFTAMTVALIAMGGSRRGRWKGAVLLLAYALYTATLYGE